jgi:hypothetical protein
MKICEEPADDGDMMMDPSPAPDCSHSCHCLSVLENKRSKEVTCQLLLPGLSVKCQNFQSL